MSLSSIQCCEMEIYPYKFKFYLYFCYLNTLRARKLIFISEIHLMSDTFPCIIWLLFFYNQYLSNLLAHIKTFYRHVSDFGTKKRKLTGLHLTGQQMAVKHHWRDGGCLVCYKQQTVDDPLLTNFKLEILGFLDLCTYKYNIIRCHYIYCRLYP